MVKIIFWLSVFLILYVYIGYPLVLYLLALLRPKQVKKGDILPMVTLIIPAHNEEKVIREKLENSLSLNYPKDKLEILVASDGSTDKTVEIVKEYNDRRVILLEWPQQEGKRATLFKSMPLAQGEIVAITDADGILHKDALRNLVRNFNDKDVGCVSGLYKDPNPDNAGGEGLYWKYENLLKKLESKGGLLLGAVGNFFAIRKELYLPINKYRGDDFCLGVRVAQQGFNVVCEPEAISFHRWFTNEQQFGRMIRMTSWFFASALILLKESLKPFRGRLIFQLISHKLLRWLLPLFLIAAFISNCFIYAPLYTGILLFQIAFYTLAIFGYLLERKNIKLISLLNVPYYFSLINLASLVAIGKALFGKPPHLWEKTAG